MLGRGDFAGDTHGRLHLKERLVTAVRPCRNVYWQCLFQRLVGF
jgi:hypothetical protein